MNFVGSRKRHYFTRQSQSGFIGAFWGIDFSVALVSLCSRMIPLCCCRNWKNRCAWWWWWWWQRLHWEGSHHLLRGKQRWRWVVGVRFGGTKTSSTIGIALDSRSWQKCSRPYFLSSPSHSTSRSGDMNRTHSLKGPTLKPNRTKPKLGHLLVLHHLSRQPSVESDLGRRWEAIAVVSSSSTILQCYHH